MIGEVKDGSLRCRLMVASGRNASGELEVRSPYDDNLLAKVEAGGADHVDIGHIGGLVGGGERP